MPDGNVINLSEKCLIEVLSIVNECYLDFDVYIDPRALFSTRAMRLLNWSLEDIEEFAGFPRGWTDIDYQDDTLSNTEIRLKLLSKYGGDETLQIFLEKYLLSTGIPK